MKNLTLLRYDFKMIQREKQLAKRISAYLLREHPEIIFKFDLASDAKLTIGQAKRNKELLGRWSQGHPDLVIYERRKGFGAMFLELKETKNGKVPNTEHTRRQSAFHALLRKKGYWCDFCVGYDDCIAKIEAYLKLKKIKKMKRA
jgi:hypothetical protein